MTAFVDTNVLVRHLTGDPQAMAERATAFLAAEPELYLADLIVAETIYVLESFYKAPREQVAEAMRSLLAMRSMITVDPALLLRAIEVYEVDRLDFASVREGGEEGPATPDEAPPYEAVQGGDAFEMVVAACNADDYDTDAVTLEEAVAHGRAQLAAMD